MNKNHYKHTFDGKQIQIGTNSILGNPSRNGSMLFIQMQNHAQLKMGGPPNHFMLKKVSDKDAH